MVAMFGKKAHGDVKKSAQKVLDPKKDTVTRLKHLRIVLDLYEVQEAKSFFEQNYSHIYYIFYDNFVGVEADLKQKTNKAHRDELDVVLDLFEKILILLPELIHKRWQYHSIGRLMKKLLHSGNGMKTRLQGMRLFLIWYQILMDNATENCHRTYASLVPRLGSDEALDLDIFTVRTFSDSTKSEPHLIVPGPVTAVEISAMLPAQSGEKPPDDVTKVLLESLLTFMVHEVKKVEWVNKEMREFSFNFLFNKFKQYYLLHIFPDFRRDTSIYNPTLDLPDNRLLDITDGPICPQTIAYCQEAVVKWMATFTHNTKRQDTYVVNPPTQEKRLEDATDGQAGENTQDPHNPGSNASTLSAGTMYTERDSANSSVSSDDHSMCEYDIVRHVLYSNRENVNIIHEIYRQAFLFTFNYSVAIKRVINVYKDWLQQEENRPVFMQEPPSPPSTPSLGFAFPDSPNVTPKGSFRSQTTDKESTTDSSSSGSTWLSSPFQPRVRHDSYTHAVGDKPIEDIGSNKIKAGLQCTLQVFITHAANVFLLEGPADPVLLDDQVDICKRVLNIYRSIVMHQTLEQKTWEQLLLVLLRITKGVLSESPPPNRGKTLGGLLAQPLFQTLIVTWIKANLNVFVSAELWDQFLKVLSSLTQWVELIREWAKTMDTLTRVLARQVYNLDLNDLPLDRLSEQKAKKQRGLRPQSVERPRTFSRGWSRQPQNVEDLPKQFEVGVPLRNLRKTSAPSGQQIRASTPDHQTSPMKGLDSFEASRGTLSKSTGNIPEEESCEAKQELIRKRSMSGDTTSPSHSRNSLDTDVTLVRSNSDSNLLLESDRTGGALMEDKTSLADEVLASALHCYSEDSPDGDSLNASFTSTFTDSASLTGGNRLMESQTSMYFSATEDVDNDQSPTSIHSPSIGGTSRSSVPVDKTHESLVNLLCRFPVEDQHGSMHNEDHSVLHHHNHPNGAAGVNITGPDDHEVVSITASITSTMTDSMSVASIESGHVPYSIMDQSSDSKSSYDKSGTSDKSDTEMLLGLSRSRTPSPGTMEGQLRSPEDEDGEMEEGDGGCGSRVAGKDSPTPDRESLQIEMESTSDPNLRKSDDHLENAEDLKSVLAGGIVQGWTPDVAVVLWRRMLGALGDINQIHNPEIHAKVYEYLCDLVDTLIKIRGNMSVTGDNLSSPPPPEYLPPVMIFSPWLFQALNLDDKYKGGKLLAYRLLCVTTIRKTDMDLGMEHLSQFYRILHHGLVHLDQDTTNVLVRHCGPKFFSLPLPGSTMMILDFIHAANTIAASTDLREAPRAEAVSILGSLLCFPNHFKEMPVLQPNSLELTIMQCNDVKDHIIGMLLKSGKKEPAGLARCIAISSLGIFIYEELIHDTMHPRLKEAVNVLLATLRFNNKGVAQVATDMLYLLKDHVHILLVKQPELPRKIIDTIANTISTLLPNTESSNSDEDKRLLVSIMFCLLEWCMRVPLELLLDTSGGHKSLMYKAFRVLNQVVTGTRNTLTPRGSVTLAEFIIAQDEDLGNVHGEISPSLSNSPKTPAGETAPEQMPKRKSPTAQMESRGMETNILKLAARSVMCHLVNHFGHFPMGGGPAQLNSAVQEHNDVPGVSLDELKPDVFTSPNVQFFVLNNTTLVSFVEVPAVLDVPGGGVTAGLTTAKTVTRVIIRDVAGKFCWDNSVLYGPPKCRAGSFPEEPQPVLQILEDIDLLTKKEAEDSFTDLDTQIDFSRRPDELPTYENTREDQDNLSDLLRYIGHTSPECLLRPGEPLNIPFPAPEELNLTTEATTVQSVLKQRDEQVDYFMVHKSDAGMVAHPLTPMSDTEPTSAFQLCRLFLNQLGFLQWGKRTSFDLLKKTEKLIRELKHLDNHRCRETHKIAVIYVAAGQEDKQSILNNQAGSQAYEDFVAGLGWEVDLETHNGFMGGLQKNKTTGNTAPYYASSTKEVIFHVSTRMPSNTDDDRHRKLRHLGNDEVQIIWSEHSRDYRRGIIPTEFGDVLIIIYPLHNGLCRIQINRKPEVPYFGPLFDGVIIDHKVLPGLVRATAINASRVGRVLKPYFQSFYEERAKNMETIVANHKQPTMFEDFAGQVYAPVLPQGGETIGAAPSFSYVDPLTLHMAPFAPAGTELQSSTSSTATLVEKQSPLPTSKSKGDVGSDAGSSFHRRLSLGKGKNKAKNHTSQVTTPPDSPNQPTKAKK